jgi:SAM-dependent methyltransferase
MTRFHDEGQNQHGEPEDGRGAARASPGRSAGAGTSGSNRIREILPPVEEVVDASAPVIGCGDGTGHKGTVCTVVTDRWAAGSSYEDFMGRWSRRLAPLFVSWLRIPRGAHWLDVGCGTGALTDAICRLADPASVVGCDPAAPLIEFARAQSRDPRQSYVVAGAGSLPGRDGGYGSVTSLFALNFLPDPQGAVGEMRSLAALQGTVSACVWDYGDGMEFLRRFWDAAAAEDPAAAALDEANRFPLCRRDALKGLFQESGLVAVRCEPIEIPTVFPDFDDYWRPFLGGTGPAPSYVAALSPDRREMLVQRLDQTLRRGADGVIALSARAWAVRGSVD